MGIEHEIGEVKVDIATIKQDGISHMRELRSQGVAITALGTDIKDMFSRQHTKAPLMPLILAAAALVTLSGTGVAMFVNPLYDQQRAQELRVHDLEQEILTTYYNQGRTDAIIEGLTGE